MMDTRTRWIIGLLLALVVGRGVALIIVAGDDSDSGEPVTTESPSATLTEPTTTPAPTTSTATGATGGTPAPGGTTTVPDGQGGL
jgi:hypothetical protein